MEVLQQPVVKRKERIHELDVLRALAFLGVVFQHALGVYIRNADLALNTASMLGMLFNVVKFAVPAFVFLTGMTLLYNYYEKLQYGSFLQKRSKEILVPYVLWTVIYALYDNGIPHFSISFVVELIKNMILGRQYYHLWFVPMIFQFYLFYPFLRYLIRTVHKWTNTRGKLLLFLALFTAAYAWLMWFTAHYIGAGQLHMTSLLGRSFVRFVSQDALFWIFYFALGAVAALTLPEWRSFVQRSVPWNSFLYLLLFVWVGYELLGSVQITGHVDVNYSTSLKPSMFFYTLSEMVLLYGLSIVIAKQQSRLYRLLDFIGKYSYGAYLAHAWVLIYAVRVTGHLLPRGHQIFSLLCAFVLCSALTVALVYLISKIPYANWLIGSTNKKGQKAKPSAATSAGSVSLPQ